MNKPEELRADNLDQQISSMLEGKTTMVDPALVKWCQEDFEYLRSTVTDKRKLSKVHNNYENFYLLWSLINSRTDPESDDWATVCQVELKKIVDRGTWGSDAKQHFDAQGWADWEQGDPHRMRIIPSGEPVLVDLVLKSTDKILGDYTDDEPACFYARLALNETEIIEEEAKEIIHEIYLNHIERRDAIRRTGVAFVPFTRREENVWWECQIPERFQEDEDYNGFEAYNKWMMAKAGRVSASIINPVRQIRAGQGAVFRVEKRNGHRLFTPFAFLKRELRKAVRLQGEKLVSLDIRSCQPTLLANKTKDEELLNDCLENNFYSKVSDHLEAHSAHPLSPYPTIDGIDGMDDEYLRWVEFEWPKLRTPPRDRAKFAVMEYLFGPNQEESKHKAKDQFLIQEFMFGNYGKTAKYVHELKEKMVYSQVARDLQAAESKLFIDQYYCTDLREAGILGLTVHDAVYVKESDADEAEEVFRERIRKSGIRAKLDRE